MENRVYNFAAGPSMLADDVLKRLKEELFNLRFRLATGQLENVMQLSAVRKDIARALTVQRQKELKADQ